MCYDIKFLTQKKFKYAKRLGESDDEINRIEADLNILTKNYVPQYHASGFMHPDILCFTKDTKIKPNLFQWGLIPHWTKSEDQSIHIQNKTINARIETIESKPSFKYSANKRRCIVMIDGFYEHHHQNQKNYPFYIHNKIDKPMLVGGLWDSWNTGKGYSINTVSIITTKAQGIMKTIHNNPKLSESRMPLLITDTQVNNWLSPTPITDILNLIIRNNDYLDLISHSVKPLRGKNYIGNHIEVSAPYVYPELNITALLS